MSRQIRCLRESNTNGLFEKQIAELFGKDRITITRHIQNIYKDNELEQDSVCSFFEHTGSDGKNYKVQFYNLDMIIAVGYRVKSPNGIVFRKWATSILKDYMLKGYDVNQKRLEALDRTVKIQSRIIASTLELDEKEVLNIVETYADALTIH